MTELGTAGDLPVSALVADPARIKPDASLLEVADALVESDVGALVVGEGDRPAGIVSERDLIRAIARRRLVDGSTAMDVATKQLVWCDATATVAEVAAEMGEHYIRHVLVEEDGRFIGVVSARDLLGVYAAGDVDTEA
ncbi:MAG TPA: CBS domain-containing protein [Microthrixaceae bacterium]|nr:CBS domain-containing protein [Microthrixaceae bacterium]